MPHATGLSEGSPAWQTVRLTDNLCIVGSVNMDETTFGFSRKVLDRAFVIEFSTVDLSAVGDVTSPPEVATWTSEDWRPPALSLAAHPERNAESVSEMIETLTHVNDVLAQGQLQFGYRVRDEIVMFCLAARQCSESFSVNGGTVDPLDIAIAMKVLPRIQGGGATISAVLNGLSEWASPPPSGSAEEPGTGNKASFPFCAERLELMLRRLKESGFTSYWL